MAVCVADSPRRLLFADPTGLLSSDNDAAQQTSHPAIIVGYGDQTTCIHYSEQGRLSVLSRGNKDEMIHVTSYVFDKGPAPNCIMSASIVGKGVVLVKLHFDPTNSWYALCDTRTKQVQTYFANAFACDETGTQVAYIAGQPHFGSGNASVFVNGRVVANLTVKDYWKIQWDKQLDGFVLYNEQHERISLGIPGKNSLKEATLAE